MEWLQSISYRSFPMKRTRKSLLEEYVINERFADKAFVKDFLNERTRKAMTNRYGIKIRTSQEHTNVKGNKTENTEIVGKVRLMRKNTLIDEATLVTKSDGYDIIYWKFNQ